MSDACDITNRPPEAKGNPSPETIVEIIEESANIAIIGLSKKPGRASLDVGLYLKDNGFNIIPVNPRFAEWEGVKAYPSLGDVPGDLDIVDVFRRADSIDELVDDIIAKKPKYVWFQLGIVNNEAAVKLRGAGIVVVQDKCLKIEHALLKVAS